MPLLFSGILDSDADCLQAKGFLDTSRKTSARFYYTAFGTAVARKAGGPIPGSKHYRWYLNSIGRSGGVRKDHGDPTLDGRE